MMFEELMEAYKKMSQSDKKSALMKELKRIIVMLQSICEEKGISFRQITSKEILDIDEANQKDYKKYNLKKEKYKIP